MIAWLIWRKWRARRSPEYSPPELYFGTEEQGEKEGNGGTPWVESVGSGTEVTKGGSR